MFPNVAMPHVLWELSGINRLVDAGVRRHEKAEAAAIAAKGLSVVEPAPRPQVRGDDARRPTQPGSMTPRRVRASVADLVNFMDYMAEPSKNERIGIGLVVLLFLGVLFVLRVLDEARVLEGRALSGRVPLDARRGATGPALCPFRLTASRPRSRRSTPRATLRARRSTR